jgi:hypothetical protein
MTGMQLRICCNFLETFISSRTQQTSSEVQLFIYVRHVTSRHVTSRLVTSPWVQLEVSTGFIDCLPDLDLIKIRPVVLEIFHANWQRAMAKLVHNPRQITAESLPTGQVRSAQLRKGRQATSFISNGGSEVTAVHLVDHNRFLFSLNIYVISIQSMALRLTALLGLTYLYKEVPPPSRWR